MMTSFVLLVLLALQVVSGANILFLAPYTSPSHSNFIRPVVKELAIRGHNITFWSGLKLKNDNENITVLYSQHLAELHDDNYPIDFGNNHPLLLLLFTLPGITKTVCEKIYKDDIFRQLSRAKGEYDLIVAEALFNECSLTLVHYLEIPFVYMNSVVPPMWHLDAIASPLSFDHFPNPTSGNTDQMNFVQRFCNAITGIVVIQFRNWVILPAVDRMAAGILADPTLPSIGDIERNVSMYITNTHISVNYQLPKTADLVEAGGLHCVPSKPLPEFLERYVTDSEHEGFILLSFGSILRGSNLPAEARKVLVATFSRLRQRVLWKWEGEPPMANVSSNVKFMPWLPQQDLLGHPKIKLFITHGGLFSNHEAVYHGVPVIGLPVFGDQYSNMQKAERDGYAINLRWDALTEEILYNSIQEILHNHRYKEKVSHLSKLMRDQMEHPLDRATHSIEYVIRHEGAAHLRSAARKLSPWQRALLDIFLVACMLSCLFFYLAFRLVKIILRKDKVGAKKKND